MTLVSPLQHVHKKGIFGDCEDNNEKNLIKISEVKNLLIFQIVQYKKSNISLKEVTIDGLNLSSESLRVTSNNRTRIL